MDLEVDMKAIVHLSQTLPAVVMVKLSSTHLGTIPVVPTSGRDISKATNAEQPKDLAVCPEVTCKQCDLKGSRGLSNCATLNIQDFLNVFAPAHFYNNVLFLIGNLIFLTPGLLISQPALVCLDLLDVLSQNAEFNYM